MNNVASSPPQHSLYDAFDTSGFDAVRTYNAAADTYDEPELGFWDRHGKRVVDALDLQPGQLILDACCGAGAASIPAAQKVGKNGQVVGIDVAENILDLARLRAQDMANTVFDRASMEVSGFPDEMFDAIICNFGLYFANDINRQLAEFVRMLAPNGKLAITIWQKTAFEPGYSLLNDELANIQCKPKLNGHPFLRLTDQGSLADMMAANGLANVQGRRFLDRQPIERPEDFWNIAMGTGFRSELQNLSSPQRHQLQKRLRDRFSNSDYRSIDSTAICVIGTKL